MADRIPQLELGNQLCFALYRASRAAIRAYGPLLADLQLTYPQYLTMLVLWEADGPLPVGALGERLQLDSGTLTPLLKRLQQRGLVVRSRDPEDERRVLISLTGDGAALRELAAGVPAAISRDYHVTVSAARKLIDELHGIADTIERGRPDEA